MRCIIFRASILTKDEDKTDGKISFPTGLIVHPEDLPVRDFGLMMIYSLFYGTFDGRFVHGPISSHHARIFFLVLSSSYIISYLHVSKGLAKP
jgi:hypothetical protein